MSCQNYRIIEMTNENIGAQSINALMPLGRVTRLISTKNGNAIPFEITTSGADTVMLTQKGYYNVLYNASVDVTVASSSTSTITLSLLVNGITVYSATTTAGATGTYNLTLPKAVRVFANCASQPTNCPVSLQVQLTGTAITGGKSVLKVDSCVNG